MNNESGLTSKALDILTLGVAEPFFEFLRKKVKSTDLALWVEDTVQKDTINQEIKRLIETSAYKAKKDNQHFSSKNIKDLLKHSEVLESIYSIIAFTKSNKEIDEILEKISLKSIGFNRTDQKRARNFLKSFSEYLKSSENDYLNVGTRKILAHLDGITETLAQQSSSIEQLQKAHSNVSSLDSFFDIELEEIDELYDENKFTNIRQKAEDLLKLERKLPNVNLDKITDILFKLVDTYLIIPDFETQKQALPYLKEIENTSTDTLKRNVAKIYRLMLNQKIENCFNLITKNIESHGRVKRLLNPLFQLHIYEKDFTNALKIAKEVDNLKYILIVHLESKDYEKAIEVFEEIKSKEEVDFSVQTYYQSAVVSLYENVKSIELDKNDVKRIENCIEIIQKVIDNDLKHLFQEQISSLLLGHSFLLYKIGNVEDSLKFLKVAFERDPNNKTILNNLIACATECSDLKTIKDVQNKIDLSKQDFLLRLLMFEINIIEKKDIKDSVKQLKNILDSSKYSKEEKSQVLIVYIRGLLADLEYTRVESELARLEKEFSTQSEYFKCKANYYSQLKDHPNVFISLSKALELAESELQKNRIKRELAEHIYKYGEKDQLDYGIQLYDELTNDRLIDQSLINLITLKYRVGDKIGALEKCSEILENTNPDQEQILNIKGIILLKDDNFVDARPIYERLKQLNPKTDYLLNLASIYARTGDEILAKDLIIKLRIELEPGDSNFILLSQLSFILKDFQQAINDAGNAMLTENPAIEVCFQFFMTAMNLPKEIKLSTEQKKNLIKARKLLTQSNSKDFFIREFKIDVKNPEKMKEQLLELLPDGSEVGRGFKYYLENKLPAYYLSKVIGRDFYSTTDFIFNDSEMKIWSSTGEFSEYEFNDNSVNNATDVVVDLLPLITLNRLNQLSILEHFRSVIIHQHTFDELKAIERQYEKYATDGEMMLLSNGKEIGTREIDKNDFDNHLRKIKELNHYIKSKVSILGNPPGKSKIYQGKHEEKLSSVLGKPTTSSLNLCAINNFTFYSDDFITRGLGHSYNVKSFDTVSLIRKLSKDGLVKNSVAHNLVINLLLIGYHFLRINSSTLIFAIRKRNFIKYSKSLAPFNFLTDKVISPNSLVQISIQFLNSLWNDLSIIEEHKIKWTSIFIDHVFVKSDRPSSQKHSILHNIMSRITNPLILALLKKTVVK